MHRAYQPLTPANNIFLKRLWDENYFKTHRRKVVAAKPRIDNKPPKTYMHLHIKLKKLQIEGERLASVERDNRILLERMAHIMRSGGRVHSQNKDYMRKSLNKTKRQRELLRITHENLAILKRLTSKEPHYNHNRWNHEWKMNQQYMMNISKFPHIWRDKHELEMRKMQQAAANRWIVDQFQGESKGQGNRKPFEFIP
ncbi:sperm axonemal maintenance protein CFAP97D1-like [Ylistrum balloti]|uniref:sperm axonemal maintenance protein CFAP97D1-like n=1 Tax=Ylistrum balloti TaxID=509963 RepID=UPI002905A41F|nr:sperm axonemal maintenance protein CFAP97D1-like [Ylistrum balloti]